MHNYFEEKKIRHVCVSGHISGHLEKNQKKNPAPNDKTSPVDDFPGAAPALRGIVDVPLKARDR